ERALRGAPHPADIPTPPPPAPSPYARTAPRDAPQPIAPRPFRSRHRSSAPSREAPRPLPRFPGTPGREPGRLDREEAAAKGPGRAPWAGGGPSRAPGARTGGETPNDEFAGIGGCRPPTLSIL